MPFDFDVLALRIRPRSRARRAALFYGFTALFSLACLVAVLQLQRFDPRYPYDYSSDALLHVTVVKAMVERGWYQHIDRLSAPGGLRLEDFPMGDNLCCTLIRFLALWTSNPFLIQNVFFIGLFPVTAVVTSWTLRRFGLSAGAAFMGGVLYALLPYHFLRGTWHLFLGAYFLVPPVCLVAWWTMRGTLFAPPAVVENPAERRARQWRLGGSIGVCMAIGCNAVYYPFFACLILAAAGTSALVVRRDGRHFALALALAALVGTMVVVNLLPTILYVHQHGQTDTGARVSGEAEVYGLKLAQLLLPIRDHRLHVLKVLSREYRRSAPLVNENEWSSLGLVGSAGLVVLLFWAVFVRGKSDPPRAPGEVNDLRAVLGPISMLNLVAVLFGTIGGFSSLFALLVSPQIRAYNRISVFIAFFGLLASGAVIDGLFRRRLHSPAARAGFFAGMIVLTGFGVWDQTSRQFVPDYHQTRHDCIDDARYFARIENALPPWAMVFQLPAAPFPEAGVLCDMGDYSHLRGYVQTRTLRWSYGAIRGRPEEIWNRQTASFPPGKMLTTLAAAGFSGLYLDGNGYADHGVSEVAQLSAALGGAVPLLSVDGRTAFFDLTPHTAALLHPEPDTP